MAVDWLKIRNEYVSDTSTSYRKLAKKYKIHPSTVTRRATAENWVNLRAQAAIKSEAKIVNAVAERDARRIATIEDAADKLIEAIITGLQNGSLTVNAAAIKATASALKDIRDIKGIRHELDVREQEARIKKYLKDTASGNTDDNNYGVLLIPEIMPPEDETDEQ